MNTHTPITATHDADLLAHGQLPFSASGCEYRGRSEMDCANTVGAKGGFSSFGAGSLPPPPATGGPSERIPPDYSDAEARVDYVAARVARLQARYDAKHTHRGLYDLERAVASLMIAQNALARCGNG